MVTSHHRSAGCRSGRAASSRRSAYRSSCVLSSLSVRQVYQEPRTSRCGAVLERLHPKPRLAEDQVIPAFGEFMRPDAGYVEPVSNEFDPECNRVVVRVAFAFDNIDHPDCLRLPRFASQICVDFAEVLLVGGSGKDHGNVVHLCVLCLCLPCCLVGTTIAPPERCCPGGTRYFFSVVFPQL